MSAKDAPIALRSHQTLVGVVDKWRQRREWIRREAGNWIDEDDKLAAHTWVTLHVAAQLWEARFGG